MRALAPLVATLLAVPGLAAAAPDLACWPADVLALQVFDGSGSLGAQVERTMRHAALSLGLMVLQFHDAAGHVLRFFPEKPAPEPDA